jgi:hypothetical protein
VTSALSRSSCDVWAPADLAERVMTPTARQRQRAGPPRMLHNDDDRPRSHVMLLRVRSNESRDLEILVCDTSSGSFGVERVGP